MRRRCSRICTGGTRLLAKRKLGDRIGNRRTSCDRSISVAGPFVLGTVLDDLHGHEDAKVIGGGDGASFGGGVGFGAGLVGGADDSGLERLGEFQVEVFGVDDV